MGDENTNNNNSKTLWNRSAQIAWMEIITDQKQTKEKEKMGKQNVKERKRKWLKLVESKKNFPGIVAKIKIQQECLFHNDI